MNTGINCSVGFLFFVKKRTSKYMMEHACVISVQVLLHTSMNIVYSYQMKVQRVVLENSGFIRQYWLT